MHTVEIIIRFIYLFMDSLPILFDSFTIPGRYFDIFFFFAFSWTIV